MIQSFMTGVFLFLGIYVGMNFPSVIAVGALAIVGYLVLDEAPGFFRFLFQKREESPVQEEPFIAPVKPTIPVIDY